MACSATDSLTIQPVVITPVAGARDGAPGSVEEYYHTVFSRMRDALRGGTPDGLAELRYLLQIHKREGMIDFAARQIAQFELLADGLELQLRLPGLCRVEPIEREVRAQQPQKLRFLVNAPAGQVLRLGGTDADALAFSVLVKTRDFDATGQFLEVAHNLTLAVSESHELQPGSPLDLRFELPAAGPQVAIREMLVIVEVLPGIVELDGRRLPISQSSRPRPSRSDLERLPAADRISRTPQGHSVCASYRAMLYPEGYESIEKAPMKTLVNSIQLGEARYFRHVFLAAHFLGAADRDQAMALLIGWVRNGTMPQSQVAMGSLRLLSRQDLPVTDRRAWLRWWQDLASKPGQEPRPQNTNR